MRPPVLGDGCPSAEPHAFVTLDVLEQARQRPNPAGPADDPAVKANAHHARSSFDPHPVQPVKGIAAIREELIPGAEITAALQAAVVGIEAIGNYEVSLARDFCPVGQVFVIGVAVIQEAPLSTINRRVFGPGRPVYQPTGLRPIRRVVVSILRSMCSRSTFSGTD